MFAEERQEKILEMLKVNKRVSNTELIKKFGVSGTTIRIKYLNGVHPSIIAASSISREIPFTKPVNMKTASPAPNPRYTTIIPRGLDRCKRFANFDNVNITIWNGTIMENRHST